MFRKGLKVGRLDSGNSQDPAAPSPWAADAADAGCLLVCTNQYLPVEQPRSSAPATRHNRLLAPRQHLNGDVRAVGHDAVHTRIQEPVHRGGVIDRPDVHLDARGVKGTEHPA